jgi:spore coat protein U-like protein
MKHIKRYWAVAIVICIASMVVAVNVSQAATANGSLAMSATVAGACSVGASSIAFGNITNGVALSGTGSVSVTCSSGGAYTVDLGSGLNLSGGHRRMSSGGSPPNFLTYDLYQDASHLLLWGTSVSGTTEAGTGTGLAQNITVYGNVPAQASASGVYSDSVTITVSF